MVTYLNKVEAKPSGNNMGCHGAKTDRFIGKPRKPSKASSHWKNFPAESKEMLPATQRQRQEDWEIQGSPEQDPTEI
jgi:hypothetical protein